jgi:hypothetical protein
VAAGWLRIDRVFGDEVGDLRPLSDPTRSMKTLERRE